MTSATTIRITSSRKNRPPRVPRGAVLRPAAPAEPPVPVPPAAPAPLADPALADPALALADPALALASFSGGTSADPESPAGPWSEWTVWAWSTAGDPASRSEPASGSAPGVTPRPAPLIRAPSAYAPRVPGPRRSRPADRTSHGPDLGGARKPAPLRLSPSSIRA